MSDRTSVKHSDEPQWGILPAPRLVVTLESRPVAFAENLFGLFKLELTPRVSLATGEFWGDVFVKSRLPWGRFVESLVFHLAAVMALWASARLWPEPSQVIARATFDHSDVVYYDAPQYLPPLNSGGEKPQMAKKGEPEYATQPILSVPPEADNRKQTIVAPPKVKLDRDMPLPNVVEWTNAAPSVPLSATSDSVPRLPTLPVPVVAPPPQLESMITKREVPHEQADVIAPPPTVELTRTRRASDINIGHSEVVGPAPALPMDEQLAGPSASRSSMTSASAPVVPPPPSLQGSASTAENRRMIALNLHPAQPTGPVDVPAGNRRGTFAAGPQGRPGASGTPDVEGTNQTGSTGAGKSGSGSSAGKGASVNGVPPGLFVGAAPGPTSGIAGTGKSGVESPQLVTDAKPPRVSTSSPRTAAQNPNAPSELERQVFGDRKSYAMTLNTPNLNSAGGSWVIHFVELRENPLDKSDLTAPVATQEVDPGYPLELMRQNVQGTVTVSAVIREDGSVGDVHVLSGVDDRLDQYACAALARWKFRPAMKNGSPTALQAVVMIPFRPMRRSGF
jgi:TonB family protein